VDAVVNLAVGVRLVFDGELWQLTTIEGSTVTLERAGGHKRVMLARSLMSAPGLRFLDHNEGSREALAPLFDTLSRDEYEKLLDTEGHIRELLTGYRSGVPEQGLPGEPRPQYLPSEPLMERYESKAAEMNMAPRTLRRLAKQYQEDGLLALIDARQHRKGERFGAVDPRWVETAHDVLVEHVGQSQPPKQLIIDRINARVTAMYADEVNPPSRTAAYRVLAELDRGSKSFAGDSAKAKRSIADRPAAPYGRLRGAQPGDYILLDTTPLDVFAMDPITLKWVRLELTAAMSLSTRCICGLRLSPISAKAVDTATVLYETISHDSRSHTDTGLLPYPGVPKVVYLPGAQAHEGLPGTAVDTIVIDHGKMYMAEHIRTLCEQLGISIQPAGVLKPTDKPALERWFRTLREDLLAALPGYKGPDVYSRGANVEQAAFYFIDELEAIIRDWTVTRYHERPHSGLCLPSVPGVTLSPREMWDALSSQFGSLRVPADPNLVFDFLPVAWRTLQHYGVEVHGMRYDGEGINGYRNASSPYVRKDGKWPIRFDPSDAKRVWFQRPDDNTWHVLTWEHAERFPMAFSHEAMLYARKLAKRENPYPDDRAALAELLERWNAGLMRNPTERRIALRLSAERMATLVDDGDGKATGVPDVIGPVAPLGNDHSYSADESAEVGDDDSVEDEDFYGDAFEVGA
jgi:transposase InsO family protein